MIRALATLAAPEPVPVVVPEPVVEPEPPTQLHIVPVSTYTPAQANVLPPAQNAQWLASDELQTWAAADRDYVAATIHLPGPPWTAVEKLNEMVTNWTNIRDIALEPLKSHAENNRINLQTHASLAFNASGENQVTVNAFMNKWVAYAAAVPDATQSFYHWSGGT